MGKIYEALLRQKTAEAMGALSGRIGILNTPTITISVWVANGDKMARDALVKYCSKVFKDRFHIRWGTKAQLKKFTTAWPRIKKVPKVVFVYGTKVVQIVN